MGTRYYLYWANQSRRFTMVRKVVFALLLALQFSVIANMASAYPPPSCLPCENIK